MATAEQLAGRAVRGICGQVDGSVLPGLIGLEAGQSSFGDCYAWFDRLLRWNRPDSGSLLPELDRAAAALPWDGEIPLALDWFGGRRTPDADQRARAALSDLHLGVEAPELYRALVLATACGARAIVERMGQEGVLIDRVRALGGIAVKSPFVVQCHADVLGRAIEVVESDQCCALGAAIAAAVAAGVHPGMPSAQAAMASGIAREHRPDPQRQQLLDTWYQRYCRLAETNGCF